MALLPLPQSGRRVGWRSAHDPSRLAVRLAALTVLVICTLTSAVVWLTLRQLLDDVIARDLDTANLLAHVLSGLPPDERPAALPESNERRSFVLVSSDGSVSPPDLGTGQRDARWQRWGARVVLEAELRQYLSTRDPDDVHWRFVTARLADGSTVLLGRPDTPQPPVQVAALRALTAALLGIALIGAVALVLVRRGFQGPLDRLIEASEDLRWRGKVRPSNLEQVNHLARRGDHVGRLARSLGAVDRDINRHFLELSTLLETFGTIGASLDADELFERVLHQLQRLFDVERCAVLSLDERADIFVIQASAGLCPEFVKELRVGASELNSPTMRALRTGNPIQVSDTASDLSFTEFRSRSERYGYRCVLVIPLRTSVAAPSALLLYKAEPYRYSHSELELAMSFASFVSIAMENAALYRRIDTRLQEKTRQLEAIVESLDDGLVLAGPDGIVSYHNTAATGLLAERGEELVGYEVEELLKRLGGQPGVAAGHVGAQTQELTTSVGGERRDIRIRTFEVADERGVALGHGHLWQDITRDRHVERLKSSLLATASHELRAPLANIKGYVSTLLAEDVKWELSEQREFLTTISRETDRLTALVASILDMSRIEAGVLEIRRELVDVRDLVDGAVAGLSPDRRDRLRINVSRRLPLARLDPARIETAVRNLVDNALKFSPENEPVTITAQASRDELRIAVTDRGVGVPEELRDRIFDSFVRGDETLARSVGGFGLGLAICRGFVTAHGGRVWCRTRRPGSSFVLSLPMEEQETR